MGCFKFKQIENINLNIKMEEKNNNKTENSNESKKSEVGNYAFKFPLEFLLLSRATLMKIQITINFILI